MLISKFYSWQRYHYYLKAKALLVSCSTNKELGRCQSVLIISENLNKLKKQHPCLDASQWGGHMAKACHKIGEEKSILGVLAPGAERCTSRNHPRIPAGREAGAMTLS